MRGLYTFVSAVVLSSSLTVLIQAQSAPQNIVDACKQRGMEAQMVSGRWLCVKATYTSDCPFPGTEFYDERADKNDCCDPPRSLHKFAGSGKTPEAGICCPDGTKYMTETGQDPKQGACCKDGEVLFVGTCEKKKPPPPIPPIPQPKPEQCTPPVCKGPCDLTPVCGDENSLGVKYGSCYVLTFSDGQQLGRDRDDYEYRKNGYIQDIPLKVCKSPTDCSPGGLVTKDQSFALEDQIGHVKDAKGTKGWGNSHGGGHIKMTGNPTQAAVLNGRTSCSGGKCALQLTGGPQGGSLNLACPQEHAGITFHNNPRAGQRFGFNEVPCDGDYPTWRAAKARGEL